MPKRFLAGVSALALLVVSVGGCSKTASSAAEISVFAAASLRDVLTEIAEDFEADTGIDAIFNFAGSNVLALQIEASRAADVYLSANEQWMDYLDQRELLAPGSRRVFLSNRLAVIAHRESEIELAALSDLGAADFRYLSIADPEAVPAGRYAKMLLGRVQVDGVDLWQRLSPRVAPAPDVRAALGMVEASPEVLGVVYVTDARSSTQVKVLAVGPEPPAPPIRYSAAAIQGRSVLSRQLLDFLDGEIATGIFESHGFTRPPAHG